MYRSAVNETAQVAAATAAAEHGRATNRPHTGADDAHIDVATGLVQLTSLVQGIYARVSERHDLTPVQAKLLCVLLDGPRGMAELARCFGVEKAALTGLMDRAERRHHHTMQNTLLPGSSLTFKSAPCATIRDRLHRQLLKNRRSALDPQLAAADHVLKLAGVAGEAEEPVLLRHLLGVVPCSGHRPLGNSSLA
jgi:hypothetical protein